MIEFIAQSVMEGQSLHVRSTFQLGDIVRSVQSGRVFMIESDDFIRDYYAGDIWDEDLWKWKGDFPVAPLG